MPRLSRARVSAWSTLFVAATWLTLTAFAQAGAPLHERIDRLVEAGAEGEVPPLASDSEFLRRVYLDLIGRIPTPEEAREFLDDQAADKRSRLIDRLLDNPEHPRRLREQFNAMLMERRGTDENWNRYLEASFKANKPWDELVSEILLGIPEDESQQGVEYFLVKRLEHYGQNPVDYDGLTRDIGRLFLGMDLQCANCHNHLYVDDYKQQHFKGLFLFTSNTFLRNDGGQKVLSEKVMDAKLEYNSVFEEGQKTIGPKLPGGPEVEIPQFAKGQEWAVPPDRKKRFPGKPKFSPREILSRTLPQADNEAFNRNAANRLWFMMMGRGIVDPLDMHHSDNPPSHPELLDLLADEFVAMEFDIRAFLRELALTRTYQRTSLLPEGERVPQESFLVAIQKGLSCEQLAWSTLRATGQWERLVQQEAFRKAMEEGKTPEKLKGIFEEFAKAFANPEQEPEVEFRPSVKAALFVSNSDLVQSWLVPAEGNLVDRLAKIQDGDQLLDELYLAVLTRHPSDEERAAMSAYLQKRSDDRVQAVKNLAWALLASTEFCVNH